MRLGVRARRRGGRHAARQASPRRSAVVLAGWLAAAWAVPAGAHLLGVDVVLPVLVLLGTASLLRSGRTAVDRLVVATALLLAAAGPAGWLFSVWPFGLAPVAVAGSALSVLVGVAAATGRRPAGAPGAGRDLGAVVVGVTALVVAGAPLVGRSFTDRLALLLQGEDLARHAAVFDAIGRAGGYLYLSPDTGSVPSGLVPYPQASHLAAALLDGFVRGGGPTPSPESSFTHFVGWTVAVAAFAAGSTAWAVGWVAATRRAGWWVVPLSAVVLGVTVFAVGPALLLRGYPSELAGLGLLAVAVGLLVRPGGPVGREHAVCAGVLLAGVAGTYYLFAPPLLVIVAWWALVHRRALRVFPVVAAVTAAATAAATVAPVLVNTASDPVEHVLTGGPVIPVDRAWLAVLSALAVLPFAVRGTWRHPVWRTAGVALAAFGGFALAIGVYQVVAAGATSYYVEKTVHALLVVELVLLGGVAALLRPAGGGRRAREAAAATLTAFAVLVGFRVLAPPPDPAELPRREFLPVVAAGESTGRAWLSGRLRMDPEAASVLAAIADQPVGPRGRTVLLFEADGRGVDFYSSQYAGMLRRHLDEPSFTAMLEVPKPRTPTTLTRILDGLGPRPVKVVTRNPAVRDRVARYAATHPAADVVVQVLPPLRPAAGG